MSENRQIVEYIDSTAERTELNTYRPAIPFFQYILMAACGLILIVLIAALVYAWDYLKAFAPLILLIAIIVSIAGIVLFLHNYVTYHKQMQGLHLESAREELAAKRATTRMIETHILPADERGNRAAIWHPQHGLIVAPTGNSYAPVQNVPHSISTHYAPHISYKNDVQGVDAAQQALLTGNAVKPTIDELVQAMTYNGFQVPLGRDMETNEVITAELNDAHLKIIGGTRMGKSCLAGAIIKTACQTHDTNHLRIALLDLEDKTSRLFVDEPHILEVNTSMKKVKMHAHNVLEVAQYLVYLHALMMQRYNMTQAQLDRQPHVLVYVEEFLYWKKQLKYQTSPAQAEQALASFSGLATRGLKANIHLMACAQVDYRDEALVDAMSQFIGVNVAFAVKPDAARAAGFVSSDLLKRNYADRTPGQFVAEMVGGSFLGVAPDYNVKALLRKLESPEPSDRVVVTEYPDSGQWVESDNALKPVKNEGKNQLDAALQARVRQMMQNPGETMKETMIRVWGKYPGSAGYEQAKQEYIACLEYINEHARRSMDN